MRAGQRIGGDHAGRLGHPVGLDDRDTKRPLEPAQCRWRQRSRGGPDEANGLGGRAVTGLHGQDGDDGRNGVDPGDLLFLDHGPEPAAAELAVQHQAGLCGQGGEQPHHLGVDVEQRETAVATVGRGQPVVDRHARGHVRQLTVTEQDPFGRAAGPAGAQEDAARRRHGARPGRPVLLTRPGRREHGQTWGETEAAVRDDHLWLGYVQHLGQGGGRCGWVERDHYPARAGDGDQGTGVFDRVRQPDGHPGPGRYSVPVQAPGPGAGGALQVGKGQLCLSPGILKVDGAAPLSSRRVDPLLYQRHVPFFS